MGTAITSSGRGRSFSCIFFLAPLYVDGMIQIEAACDTTSILLTTQMAGIVGYVRYGLSGMAGTAGGDGKWQIPAVLPRRFGLCFVVCTTSNFVGPLTNVLARLTCTGVVQPDYIYCTYIIPVKHPLCSLMLSPSILVLLYYLH